MTSHCWEPIQLPNNAAGEWMERLGYYAEKRPYQRPYNGAVGVLGAASS